ncbi:glycosyltransferase [Paenarthrobacter sp. NPDC089989]|uniref:glycosyltransferase n=1 Tax=unclassified Paenarthrobacter TaxID=2634190 RepID=UPI0037C731C0
MVLHQQHVTHVGSVGLQSFRHFESSPMTGTMRRSYVDLEVVIPAYNEAARIPGTLRQTVDFLAGQPWSSRIVVVDNGSVDETAAVVRRISHETQHEVPISVVGCSRRGKGAAVRRGLLSGTSRFTGFFDADLATPLETLVEVMTHLSDGAAAVIASRHAPGSRFVQPQHPVRRVGGTAFRVLTRSKVKGIRDTQCGFKFFEREALTAAMVQCRSTGFAFDVELLLRLQHNHSSIIELPVSWTDGAGSTFRPIRDGVSSFASVIQLQKAML